MPVHKLKTIIPPYLVHVLKNNTVSSECKHAYLSDYVIFMYTGAILRNHLNNITFFFCKMLTLTLAKFLAVSN